MFFINIFFQKLENRNKIGHFTSFLRRDLFKKNEKKYGAITRIAYIAQNWHICHSNRNKKRGHLIYSTFVRAVWVQINH